MPESSSLSRLGLSIIHAFRSTEDNLRLSTCSIERLNGAPPTDLAFGFPTFRTDLPHLALSSSFAIPRIGSTVTCIGYGSMSFPEEDSSIADENQRVFDRLRRASPSIKLVEATVTAIFVERFARGFVDGPCFAIDAELEHGQSGGPVLNEHGYVCGVIAAGASHFFDRPMALVSLLYPTLLCEIDMTAKMWGIMTINNRQSLLSLIGTKSIETDDSEQDVVLTPDQGGGFRTGPLIHRDDGPHVFHDFGKFQDGIRAKSEAKKGFRVKKNGDVSDNSA